MNRRQERMHEAATAYYLHGRTMAGIAQEWGVSRATVSRLLQEARDTGVVSIRVAPPAGEEAVGQALAARFGVVAHVVPSRPEQPAAERAEHVARAAAGLLDALMEPGTVLGLAWGTTLTEISRHLQPHRVPGSVIVQLNGSGSARRSGIPYTGAILNAFAEAYGSQVVHFPVPAFFDYAATRQAMWRERSIRGVLDLQAQADAVVFGVGSLHGALPSHVYSSGYLEPADYRSMVAEGVVGDVCTVLLRQDGTWADIALNQRASGPGPDVLAGVPRRLCVVGDPRRAPALLGGLQAGVATDLVVDALTAAAVLDRADAAGLAPMRPTRTRRAGAQRESPGTEPAASTR